MGPGELGRLSAAGRAPSPPAAGGGSPGASLLARKASGTADSPSAPVLYFSSSADPLGVRLPGVQRRRCGVLHGPQVPSPRPLPSAPPSRACGSLAESPPLGRTLTLNPWRPASQAEDSEELLEPQSGSALTRSDLSAQEGAQGLSGGRRKGNHAGKLFFQAYMHSPCTALFFLMSP